MVTLIFNKELHSTTNILVFNLATADLIISGFVNSFTVIGWHLIWRKKIKFLTFISFLGVLVGENYFTENFALCGFVAAICLIACETSLMSIGFLAFNR